MDLAGVQASDSFSVALAKVEGLVTGYKNLGIQGGVLGSSINAVTLASEQQQSQVQGLTQAWTNFIDLVTGGESSLVTVVQQVQGTLAAAGGAATSLSVSNGKVTDSIKDASDAAGGAIVNIDSLSTAGLALKSSFIQSVTAMNSNLNSLLELSTAGGQGAKGLQEVDQAGKDYVASLLPVAKGSQDATTMLYALAQEAGYNGVDSFKALATWVGNIQNPMQQAENITNALTISAGNLAKDVQDLANAIQSDLTAAMATAIAGGNGTQKAFDNAAAAIKTAHGNMDDILPSMKTLGQAVYQDLGGNINQTNNELTTFMEAMDLSPGEIKAILAKIDGEFQQAIPPIMIQLESLQQYIDQMHGTTLTITTQYITEGGGASMGINPAAPGVTPIPAKKAAGGLIPGTGSGDTVPALLTPGEAVVPKHLVSAVAPFLGAHGVPGFASGGLVDSSIAAMIAAFEATGSFGPISPTGPVSPVGPGGSAPASPVSSQFLGDWLPSSLMAAAPASSGSSGGGTTTIEGIQPIHVHVTLDGRQVWEATQKETLKMNLRNNGVATGLMKPR